MAVMNRAERNAMRVAKYKEVNAGRNPYEYVGFKICYRCKESLASKMYSLDSSKRDGLQSYCKLCARKQRIESTYSIKWEDYERMLVTQENKCAICKEVEFSIDKPLYVDHDHSASAVRGLLCDFCNRGLGNFFDSVDYLKSAIAYMEVER